MNLNTTEEVKIIWRWPDTHATLKYSMSLQTLQHTNVNIIFHEEMQCRCEGKHPTSRLHPEADPSSPEEVRKKKTVSTQNKKKQKYPGHDIFDDISKQATCFKLLRNTCPDFTVGCRKSMFKPKKDRIQKIKTLTKMQIWTSATVQLSKLSCRGSEIAAQRTLK